MPPSSILGSPGLRNCPVTGSSAFLFISGATGGHTAEPLATTAVSASTSLPIVSAGVFALTDHAVPLLAQSSSAMASDMIVVAPGVPALKRSLVEFKEEEDEEYDDTEIVLVVLYAYHVRFHPCHPYI